MKELIGVFLFLIFAILSIVIPLVDHLNDSDNPTQELWLAIIGIVSVIGLVVAFVLK